MHLTGYSHYLATTTPTAKLGKNIMSKGIRLWLEIAGSRKVLQNFGDMPWS
jgi:hypothetical protein